MPKYNTGNPVGSADPRDLYDSAQVADRLVHGDQDAYPDRRGKSRKSWAGMEREFDADQAERGQRFNTFIASSGYGFVGDYAAGIEITEYNQVVRDANGEFWRLSGSIAVPYTTTGAGLPEDAAFLPAGDAVLRQELSGEPSSGRGASLVNGAVFYLDNASGLELLPGPFVNQEAIIQGVPFKRVDLTWQPSLGFVTPQVYGGESVAGKNNEPAINQALQNHHKVYVPAGVWEIGSSLRIPSNTTLEFHPRAELKLQDGASDYLITNDDLVNGNENIRIIGNGATINGNKPGGQIRDYTSPADDRASYWGFGFWLVRVTNLVVDDFYILETESWGVAYWDVTRGYFGNFRFWQTTDEGDNGDGITGVGSDLLIENISGYANDDMIAFGNGGGSLLGNDMGMPQLSEVRDITVRNVKPEARDGHATLRGVRITGRSPDGGTTPGRIRGVTVEGVKGTCKYQAVEIKNFWQDTDPGLDISDVTLRGIERRTLPSDVALGVGHIGIDDCYIEELTIDTWRVSETELVEFLLQGPGSHVQTLNISNTVAADKTSDPRGLVVQHGRLDYVNFSNVTLRRDYVEGVDGNGFLLFKFNDADTNKTRVSLNNARTVKTDPENPQTPAVRAANGGPWGLSVKGISDFSDKDYLTPDVGDTIIDESTGLLQTWGGTAWA